MIIARDVVDSFRNIFHLSVEQPFKTNNTDNQLLHFKSLKLPEIPSVCVAEGPPIVTNRSLLQDLADLVEISSEPPDF